MDIKKHLQKFMAQQTGLSVTPLLEHGLVAATGPGGVWALTEAGHTMLNGEGDTALSEQVGGDHYKDFPIQPVEFIEKNGIRFLEGCIIKRAARHDKKTGAGAQDLRKIIHEARLLLQLRYGVRE